SQQRSLARTARAHYANQLATRERERNSLEAGVAARKTMGHFAHLQGANDVALFLDDPLRKIAAQKLSDIDPDRVAILQGICRSYRHLTDQDRPIRFNHFQLTNALVVIAENFQQHVACRSRRNQNALGLKFSSV